VVVVPTKYYNTPAQELADMGISLVIFANHNMRASITAMQKTSAEIFKKKSLASVEKEVSRLYNTKKNWDRLEFPFVFEIVCSLVFIFL